MVKKEDTGLLERKKQKLDTEILDLQLEVIPSAQDALLTTEQSLLKKLYEGDMKPVQEVLCVERHQRTKVDYLRADTPACKWGRIRENANTCGDCPFGVKLMGVIPRNDTKTVLRHLKREQDYDKKMFS